MAGGVLVVSRFVNLFPHWKKEFEAFGFKDVFFTDQERDSLNSVIRELKPSILLIGCGFYSRSTPYMMGLLLDNFPRLNIAAVNIYDFPDDLAMYFIVNGVKSYVDMKDGMEEFNRGMKDVMDGRKYVSAGVLERILMRKEYPMKAGKITERETEVIRLLCCGWMEEEIADNLHISRRTVDTHKKEIFRTLNVRNVAELIGVALKLGMVTDNDLYFYSKGLTVNPKPTAKKLKPMRGTK